MTRKISTALRDALENPTARSFAVTNDVLAGVTLLATLSLILETVPSLVNYATYFSIVEWTSVAIFTIEYIARVAYAPKKLSYVFSFFGLVDLLSILPSFVSLGNFIFLKTIRGLRILRFLRMIRLAKIARSHIARNEHSLYALNAQIYLIAITFSLLILGTLLFIFEGTSSAPDIPSGMLWALLIILGDVPYPTPSTEAGTAVMVLGRFVGLILLGLLVGLIIPLVKSALIGDKKDLKNS